MDLRDGILWGLERTRASVLKSLEGITQEQAAWRACPTCNSIGSMVIHLGRVNDTWAHRIIGGKDIWETEGWAARFGIPVEDRGWTYDKQTPAQQKPLKDLTAYFEAAHKLMVESVRTFPPARLEETPTSPMPMKLTVGQIFTLMLTEQNAHWGQIDYLNGMQSSR